MGTVVVYFVVPLVVSFLIASWVVGPRPGAPRVVAGDVLPELLPGESAQAEFRTGAFDEALEVARVALDRGAPVSFAFEIKPSGYLVGPAPGWRAWWMRTEYRLYGWWLYGSVLYPLFGIGAPRVVVTPGVATPQGHQ